MAKNRKAVTNKPIESHKHKDKRANIPTEELRDFVPDEEKEPKKILYPRDPSLDPQLVWKGKDEQDAEDLEVPTVPIYIQEKIHPQAIIEGLRLYSKKEHIDQQTELFSDFNGIQFEDLIDFYHHEQNWSNRMILGDSLLVMTSLAEKEGLKNKVQMIYFDPPYGIRFNSNWQVSTRKKEVKDGKAQDMTRQPEQIRAFRDTWKLGIHSYLPYLRDRLVVARDLLTETGSIFVQIGDENQHLVRCVLDEVFGSENFISLISFKKTVYQETSYLANVYDYILWYGKNKENTKVNPLYRERSVEEKQKGFDLIDNNDEIKRHKNILSEGSFLRADNLTSKGESDEGSQPFNFNGFEYKVKEGNHWKTHTKGLQTLSKAGRLIGLGKTLCYKKYADDFAVTPFLNVWNDTVQSTFATENIYVVQTHSKVIARCLLLSTHPGDLVLDPTCGSGTTAYVAEQWGRRWITIDTSRVSLALARMRLMSAKYPYYLLSDTSEGIRKEAEILGNLPPSTAKPTFDIKKGFVYKKIHHITLKSIANSEEIDTIYAKWQEKLEPLYKKLNKLLQNSWAEWEIPREAEEKWTADALNVYQEIREIRRQRQQEIDASIAERADMEALYDQPYEDKKRIRVTGPFTVESLSPHRVLSTHEERPASEKEVPKESTAAQFETMILDNLRKTGVQNTKKNERLKFDLLEPYAGTWINAEGEYTEQDGTVRRVAVCIGPEHGTVDPQLIKEAAKEAVQGIGFDLLLVCGFAFDPHISEEVKRYGKLTVLPVRMNIDLTMGNELLKKTGAGNLFMIFGEPDISIEKQNNGKIIVEIKGLDIYDPTTGQIRSSSTSDIACWFIDTVYNGESFFARHAYFTGGDEPYDKLQRTLRAEIDEAAWSALYSTRSLPFDPPKTGKIAVKVINHYGDEVLKVYTLF